MGYIFSHIIKEAKTIGTDVTSWVAFGAGVLSFLSPCTLPLLPLYISYITGKNVQEVKENQSFAFRKNVFLHSLVFLLGVSVVYISLGLGMSYLGDAFSQLMTGSISSLLQRLSGLLIIFMGLLTTGLLKIPALSGDYRFLKANKTINFSSTFLVGLGFAAGWTPCIGPVFSSILLLGNAVGSPPLLYLGLYVLGFSLPFLLVSFFIGKIKNILKYSDVIMKTGGIILILLGMMLLTGTLESLSEWMARLLEGTKFELLG
ncbi:cytochrome c biogenesis CcdA family protein [Carnobacterium funditum]|uniref:cytochrome c biogenesis CcdA family protein n=1 Tax=Carnobacterium funditum TaxID=2752 RepID=UPI00068BC532|nr:cytochrome c biogenesis protein CcdA [Carnobacterium funditum]